MNDDLNTTHSDALRPRGVIGGISSYDQVSGEKYAPTLATTGSRSTGSKVQPAARRRPAGTPPLSTQPKARHASRAKFAACVDEMERAMDVEAGFFVRNNSLEHVKEYLADLWAIRAQREEQFAEVLNSLQAVFANRNVEAFADQHLSALHAAFVRLRDEPFLDDDVVTRITLELLAGNIDVFRELD